MNVKELEVLEGTVNCEYRSILMTEEMREACIAESRKLLVTVTT